MVAGLSVFYLILIFASQCDAAPRRRQQGRRYCGKRLVDVLRDYCGDRGIRGPPRRYSHHRGRRGITSLCCERPCSDHVLERFCNAPASDSLHIQRRLYLAQKRARDQVHNRTPDVTVTPSGDPGTETHTLQPTSPNFRFRPLSPNSEEDASYQNFIRELWKAAAILHKEGNPGSGGLTPDHDLEHSGGVMTAQFELPTKIKNTF